MTQETQSPEPAEFRASGTDLSERRRSGVSRGPIIDIVPTPEMTRIFGARPELLGSGHRLRSTGSRRTPV